MSEQESRVPFSPAVTIRGFPSHTNVECIYASNPSLKEIDSDVRSLFLHQKDVSSKECTLFLRVTKPNPFVPLQDIWARYYHFFGPLTRILHTRKGNIWFYSIEFQNPWHCATAFTYLTESKKSGAYKDILSVRLKNNSNFWDESYNLWDMRNLYVTGFPSDIKRDELSDAILSALRKKAQQQSSHSNAISSVSPPESPSVGDRLFFPSCWIRNSPNHKTQEEKERFPVAFLRCQRFEEAKYVVEQSWPLLELEWNEKKYKIRITFAHPAPVHAFINGRTYLLLRTKLLNPKMVSLSRSKNFISRMRYYIPTLSIHPSIRVWCEGVTSESIFARITTYNPVLPGYLIYRGLPFTIPTKDRQEEGKQNQGQKTKTPVYITKRPTPLVTDNTLF